MAFIEVLRGHLLNTTMIIVTHVHKSCLSLNVRTIQTRTMRDPNAFEWTCTTSISQSNRIPVHSKVMILWALMGDILSRRCGREGGRGGEELREKVPAPGLGVKRFVSAGRWWEYNWLCYDKLWMRSGLCLWRFYALSSMHCIHGLYHLLSLARSTHFASLSSELFTLLSVRIFKPVKYT